MVKVPAGHPEKPQGAEGFKLLERMNGGHHEELANWGLSFLEIAAGADVVDIGCGGGANLRRLLARVPEGHVTGVDYSPVSVQASREHNAEAIAAGRCQVLEGDAAALPLPDGSADAVTAFETTYYWDIPRAFAEVLRVLRPGGRFLVCNEDNGRDAEALELAEHIPGMTVHTADALAGALRDAGFEIEAVQEVESAGHVALVARKVPESE